MKLRSLKFEKPDPLGAGIREEIRRQQANPESAIDLFDRPTGEELQAYLSAMIGEAAVASALHDEYELAA